MRLRAGRCPLSFALNRSKTGSYQTGLRPSTHTKPIAHALAAPRSPRSLRKRTLDVSEDPATLYVLQADTPRESLPGEGRRNSEKRYKTESHEESIQAQILLFRQISSAKFQLRERKRGNEEAPPLGPCSCRALLGTELGASGQRSVRS